MGKEATIRCASIHPRVGMATPFYFTTVTESVKEGRQTKGLDQGRENSGESQRG